MKAADVMVSNVITVSTNATVRDVADTLLKNHISAVPVVDAAGMLVGVVSEGDLMHRAEAGTEQKRSWWLNAFSTRESLAAEFVRSHSQKVGDVMSKRVVTAAPDTPLHEIASLLERNRIKRVPIVKDGKIVGIVSRANLLQALAAPARSPAAAADGDATIRRQIVAQMQSKSWARPSLINVIVHDGIVELWGIVDSPSEKKAMRVLAEVVPGVRSVSDNLIIQPITSAE